MDNIKIVSPSPASYCSLHSGTNDRLRSPRLALLTENLLETQHEQLLENINTLVSPSAPISQSGDEFLYDSSMEELPHEPFFAPDFQAALASTKQEVTEISLALWGCPTSHQMRSDLHSLRGCAQELSRFESVRTRTVGLVGGSRMGKSSIINSLLDHPCLAQSSSENGQSIPIITEYRFRPAYYDEPFNIEIDYMGIDEIKELIDELIRTWRAYHAPALQDVEMGDERSDIKTRSEVAWQTLRVMFRSHTIFTKDFLLGYQDEADIPLVEILQQWALEFLDGRPGGLHTNTWSVAAFSLEECIDELDAFISDPVEESMPALWPFIRVVRVYLRASLLQTGLVLADCPAPHKLDFARARQTERYLRNCHEIFAVTTIGHALSDNAVSDIVKRFGRHRPLQIICTKSEDVVARTVERKDPTVSLQVRTWRQQIEVLKKQVKRNEAQRRHGVPGALAEELRTRDMLQDLEHGLKRFLVERRNRQVATELIGRYAEDIQLGDLQVFCVSNMDYIEHRYDEQIRAESRLELSGIVNLRRYCHSIPARAQFEAAATFVKYSVPAFLGSLRQWAVTDLDDTADEKTAEVCRLIKHLEGIAIKKLVLPSAQVHITRTNLNHEFAAAIVLPIREHRSEWRNAALETNKEWTKWDPERFATFCHQSGTHDTETTGPRNWNEELIAPMRLHLQSNWGFFQESVDESQEELIASLLQTFDEICAPLKGTAAPTAIQNFLDNTHPRIQAIAYIIRTAFSDLLEGSLQIESDALYGHTSSYIAGLMAPAYHAASSFSPSRQQKSISSPRTHSPPPSPSLSLVDAQRKHLLTTHIASARLFPKLATQIEKSHRGVVHACFNAMVAGIAPEVDAFIRDLGSIAVAVGGSGGAKNGSEAQWFPEFAERLRGRIGVADGVAGEAMRVVEELEGGSGAWVEGA
ncbi:hypothetical protein BDV95DRAFT_504588 [Massariosphaeria phaeospora]|uniref:DUF7605 domain-containing protein n=1 Tax=Massariosphaeria phaeospora TaxID=100035 RepID=A0A7C8M5R3_9PLEO|nr:hypothetical protein BDV95DRAFT_504588 [Massariosphaeria phaeospora]